MSRNRVDELMSRPYCVAHAIIGGVPTEFLLNRRYRCMLSRDLVHGVREVEPYLYVPQVRYWEWISEWASPRRAADVLEAFRSGKSLDRFTRAPRIETDPVDEARAAELTEERRKDDEYHDAINRSRRRW